MGRFVYLICGTLLLTGCLATEREVLAVNHLVEMKDELVTKKPLIWTITLHDERGELEDVIIKLNDYGYDVAQKDDWQLDEALLRTTIKRLAKQIDQKMINPSINEQGEVIEGQKQVVLLEDELLASLLSLEHYENELSLPIIENEPTVAVEDLEGIFNEVIGSYSTRFNAGVRGRSKNIAISAEAISYYVLGPGDEFSFNGVVGERTRERGYQEAIEIVNKEFVVGIGGGICQTSSTLFNAIDDAGLEVIERTSHSKDIGYVPPNRDATVSWGGPDFKFKNPYQIPVILRSKVSLDTGKIIVEVLAKEKISN